MSERIVEMRASDEDRQRVVAALERHTGAGRLTLDEFSDRIGQVYQARTLGDLAAVTRDLPAVEAEPATPTAEPGSRRELLLVFAVAMVTLVLLAVFMALTR